MVDLHSNELVIKHTEILVKLGEQVSATCRKIEQLEKFIMAQIKDRDKQMELAKEEMDRRLESMNEIRRQLDTQALTFVSKVETDLRFKDIDSKLLTMMSSLSERKGGKKWEDHIVEVIIGLVVVVVVWIITHGVQ